MLTQGGLVGFVHLGQSAAEAEDDRATLAGVTTAMRVDDDIHLAAGAGDFQRTEDRFAITLEGEVVIEFATIDFDFARTMSNANAGHGCLATTRAPDESLLDLRLG